MAPTHEWHPQIETCKPLSSKTENQGTPGSSNGNAPERPDKFAGIKCNRFSAPPAKKNWLKWNIAGDITLLFSPGLPKMAPNRKLTAIRSVEPTRVNWNRKYNYETCYRKISPWSQPSGKTGILRAKYPNKMKRKMTNSALLALPTKCEGKNRKSVRPSNNKDTKVIQLSELAGIQNQKPESFRQYKSLPHNRKHSHMLCGRQFYPWIQKREPSKNQRPWR